MNTRRTVRVCSRGETWEKRCKKSTRAAELKTVVMPDTCTRRQGEAHTIDG
jgi:hypothetical protein